MKEKEDHELSIFSFIVHIFVIIIIFYLFALSKDNGSVWIKLSILVGVLYFIAKMFFLKMEDILNLFKRKNGGNK